MKNPSKKIKRHHRFVRRMKLVLMTLAGLTAAALLLWPQIAKQRDFLDSLFKQSMVSFNRTASIDMAKVKFLSEDKKGQPFTIISEKVLETDPEQKLVKLDDPVGHMTLNSGVKIVSSSPFAFFYQDKEILIFQDEVQVTADNGYVAYLSNVTMNHREETASSPAAVTVEGPKGNLKAEGFYLFDNGDKIDFLGKSRLVLKDDKKGKTYVITSTNGMEVRQMAQTMTAKENATLTEEINKLNADMITGYFTQPEKNKYELRRMTATGHVKIVTPTETVYGDKAVYDVLKQTATVTGKVRIVRDEGEMTGAKAVMDMRTGVSQMHAADGSSQSSGRVRGILLPSQLKKDKVN